METQRPVQAPSRSVLTLIPVLRSRRRPFRKRPVLARPRHPRRIRLIEGRLPVWPIPCQLVMPHGMGGTYIAWGDERDWFDGVRRELVMLLRSHPEALLSACCETKNDLRSVRCESLDMCSTNACSLSISLYIYRLSGKMIRDALLSIHARVRRGENSQRKRI